jgi:hypothetical protein
MRRLVAAMALGLVLVSGGPASAYLVEVTTSVALDDAEDQHEIQSAIRGAIDEVLRGAIAFTPTLVVLTNAAVVGDRLYVRLLLADRDGEQTYDTLQDSPEFNPSQPDLKI